MILQELYNIFNNPHSYHYGIYLYWDSKREREEERGSAWAEPVDPGRHLIVIAHERERGGNEGEQGGLPALTLPLPLGTATNSYPLIPLYILAGTRLTLKTGVKTLRGRISFLPQSLPVKIIVTYLICVFDTTWESKFWTLKFLFLGQFFNFSCWFEGH